MEYRRLCLIVATLLLICLNATAESPDAERIKKILQKADQNEKLAESFGFYQEKTQKKLDGERVKEQRSKLYRMTWLNNQPYLELLKIDGQPLNKKETEEEGKRKIKFVKGIKDKEEDDEDENFTWEELFSKYDFDLLPSDSTGLDLFSFRPKKGKLQQRSRFEKILNHLQGKFWVDPENNIVRAEAQINETISFGLGILGKLDTLEMKFEQTQHEDAWLPAELSIHFRVRLALLKVEEQELHARYFDFFKRPEAGHTASTGKDAR